jgi:predicted nucleotidyltransferase
MPTLFESLQAWMKGAADVRVATVFGSYARALSGEGEPADPWSDIDLQIVSTRPEIYANRAWTAQLAGQEVQAYAVRPVFGGALKVTALFSGGEADFVVIRHRRLLLGRIAFALGLHRRLPGVRKGLGEFALVMSFGQKVLKGGPGWQRFYTRAVAEVPLAHLDDAEAAQIGEVAYVDAVSIMSKIARGEFVAAQRWLHRSVVETNFRLLHELRVRRGQLSFPDGRRVERLLAADELAAVRFEVKLEAESLRAATLTALAGTRRLLTELTGRAPAWPEIK